MIFPQVTKTLCKNLLLNRFRNVRNYARVLFPLQSRQILKISGTDASSFLQGLITNDMQHFEEGAKSMYAMFLNNKGRVLFDTLLYKWEDDNSFLIECDKNVVSDLEKHLKIYKLRRAVKIEDTNDCYNLWGLISPVHTVLEMNLDPKSKINIFSDPRLVQLGSRIIAKSIMKAPEIVEIVGTDISISEDEDVYKYLRYKLGVSEGADDLLPGTCFPLEVNCDYLHGVSFHKGCYIGQELTARVHHTGVVRKRIMPIKFLDKVTEDLCKDTVITSKDKPKSNLGKLKSFILDYGLGLVRVKEVMEAKTLNIDKYNVEVVRPTWWPVEAPKEKNIITKDSEPQ